MFWRIYVGFLIFMMKTRKKKIEILWQNVSRETHQKAKVSSRDFKISFNEEHFTSGVNYIKNITKQHKEDLRKPFEGTITRQI